MALVIGLHSPVLGYCSAEGEVFVGEHFVETDCHHDCDHHDDLAEVPCEEEHEFLTLDPGDFQWSPLPMVESPVELVLEDFDRNFRPVLLKGSIFVYTLKLINPPPPKVPIFRRDAALRV